MYSLICKHETLVAFQLTSPQTFCEGQILFNTSNNQKAFDLNITLSLLSM